MLLFLTPLDSKIFDLFLRILPSLTENEKVYILTLDDDSMAYAGGFPFRREVMADVVVLLKEFGVDAIAFDLSYLDESAKRFDEDYAVEVFNQHLYSGIEYPEDLLSLIPSLGRDVDEYFAKSLAFSDNSWLTLTFFSEDELLTENESILKDENTDRYLTEHIALKENEITAINDSKTREMAGVLPAISKLLTRARSAGFVNAPIDKDGLRRRVNLVLKYNDDYYAHLTLKAMQKKLGWTSIEVTNKTITLKLEDGKDIRVPRSEDGSILINWPKKSFYKYNYMSLIELIQYTMIEPSLAENIATMYYSGFFDEYWDGEATPWDYIGQPKKKKNGLFRMMPLQTMTGYC